MQGHDRYLPLIVPFYRERHLSTLWNAKEKKFQKEGWMLKGGIWSPWFFNMRPIGDTPELFRKVCNALSDLVIEGGGQDINLLVGVEMAGISCVGGTSILLSKRGYPTRFAYTRPLPKKVRTPKEADELLENMSSDVAGYGQKAYVEGRLRDGDRVAIFDDMSSDFASKLIARLIILWQAKQLGIQVECTDVFYFLNRNQDILERIEKFSKENPTLCPAGIKVNYAIEFEEAMPLLENRMKSDEFRVISDYQKNPAQFQDPEVQREIIEMAKKAA